MVNLTGCVDEILTLGDRMLKAAEAGDWDQLSMLEEKRRLYILDCFDFPLTVDRAEIAINMIQSVRKLDQEIMSIGEQVIAQLTGQLGDMRRTKTASNVYEFNMK
jgi:Flagellar protein FliT